MKKLDYTDGIMCDDCNTLGIYLDNRFKIHPKGITCFGNNISIDLGENNVDTETFNKIMSGVITYTSSERIENVFNFYGIVLKDFSLTYKIKDNIAVLDVVSKFIKVGNSEYVAAGVHYNYEIINSTLYIVLKDCNSLHLDILDKYMIRLIGMSKDIN